MQAISYFRNEETKADFNIFVERFDVMLDSVRPKFLIEYTNVLNTLRSHNVDGNVPMRIKSKLVKTV